VRLVDTTSGSPAAINRYLLPREIQAITVRQHPAVLAGPVITMVVALPTAAILAQVVWPGRQALDTAVWIAWLLLLLRVAVKVMGWSTDYFVVTSERILMITGIVNRRVAIIPFMLVNDFSFYRSPAGRLFGYGEIRVRYGTRDQVLQRIQYLPFPEQLYLEIRHVMYPPPDEAAAGDD
jgi:hypothetical protein